MTFCIPTCTVIRKPIDGDAQVLETGILPSLDVVNPTLVKMFGTSMLSAGITSRGKYIDTFMKCEQINNEPPNCSEFIKTDELGEFNYMTVTGGDNVYLGDVGTVWFATTDSLSKAILDMKDLVLSVVFQNEQSYRRLSRSIERNKNISGKFTEVSVSPAYGKTVCVEFTAEASVFFDDLLADLDGFAQTYGKEDLYLICGL